MSEESSPKSPPPSSPSPAPDRAPASTSPTSAPSEPTPPAPAQPLLPSPGTFRFASYRSDSDDTRRDILVEPVEAKPGDVILEQTKKK